MHQTIKFVFKKNVNHQIHINIKKEITCYSLSIKDFFLSLASSSILYIKATVVMSVCVGSAWKILSVTARSLWRLPRCNSPYVIDSREKRN